MQHLHKGNCSPPRPAHGVAAWKAQASPPCPMRRQHEPLARATPASAGLPSNASRCCFRAVAQAGVYEALSEVHLEPDWIAGISVGAINAAIFAGNPPRSRVEKLREFWRRVTSGGPWDAGALIAMAPAAVRGDFARSLVNQLSAGAALVGGVPGFFAPRFPVAWLQPPGSPEATSYYDTAPLMSTLERLVDFDRINAGHMRFSVGAVNVSTGNFVYFDSTTHTIGPEHVTASGALPPGFPPVEIEGEFYWDGGLVSNTPLNYLLDQPGDGHRTVFQVDLFPARGPLPTTMERVAEREKDIRYSSRTRLNTNMDVARRRAAAAAMRLMDKLPPELREDPDARHVLEAVRANSVSLDIVQLIYRAKRYESDAKDYEFSRLTAREHWASGRADVLQTLQDPRWTGRGSAEPYGVRVFDLVSPERTTATTGALSYEPA